MAVMRKRSNYRPRPASAPMLVNRGLQETSIELTERMIVEAFVNGIATTWHFDALCDMRNALTLAASRKDDASGKTICEAMRIPMANLRERYAKTGRFGLTGDELQLVRAFCGYYRDFWIRQPVAVYEMACDKLAKFNAGIHQEKAA